MNARTFRASTLVRWGPNSNGQLSNSMVSFCTKGKPHDVGTDSNCYWDEGGIHHVPTSMLALEFGLSSTPPICDDEATNVDEKTKALQTRWVRSFSIICCLKQEICLANLTMKCLPSSIDVDHCAPLLESSASKDNNGSPRCLCNARHKPIVHTMALRSMVWPNTKCHWPSKWPWDVVGTRDQQKDLVKFS